MADYAFHMFGWDIRWRLCYAGWSLLQKNITFKNSKIATASVYKFDYLYGEEKHIAIACPTEPPIHIRYKNSFDIMNVIITESDLRRIDNSLLPVS